MTNPFKAGGTLLDKWRKSGEMSEEGVATKAKELGASPLVQKWRKAHPDAVPEDAPDTQAMAQKLERLRELDPDAFAAVAKALRAGDRNDEEEEKGSDDIW